MAEECDVIVVGGGLAGLGVATSLADDWVKDVIVLDKCEPKLDGNDRFDLNMSASFKNAGMFEIDSDLPDIKSYLQEETAQLYRDNGVELRSNGAYVMASTNIEALGTDVFLEEVSKKEFEQLEPNVQLAKQNDGVYKFKSGSQAEPEATMKILIEKARSIGSLKLLYGETVVQMSFQNGVWTVRTETDRLFKAPRAVIAAGPGSGPLMMELGLDIPMTLVYGLISQSQELTEPWLKGSILGARSYFDWTVQKIFCCCFKGNTLENTSVFGDPQPWTTHLYLNEYNNRIYLGGPRIKLPKNYPPTAVNPATYQEDVASTWVYSETLIKYPKNISFGLDSTWGGVMAFPGDVDYPFIGAIKGRYEDSLFVNTGFASAGFREAYGAGYLCAKLLVEGEGVVNKVMQDKGVKLWKIVLPGGRVTES